jgi:hypothetical protein
LSDVPEARDSVREPSEMVPVPQFDPRQGTLLGFELPSDALASMTEPLASAQDEPATLPQADPGDAAHGKSEPASGDQADAVKVAAGATKKAVARAKAPAAERAATPRQSAASAKRASPAKSSPREQPAQPEPISTKAAIAGDSLNDTSRLDSRESTLLSPGAALASVRERPARRPIGTARPSGSTSADQEARAAQPEHALPVPPAVQRAFAGSIAGMASLAGDVPDVPNVSEGAPPAERAGTVAALQEALLEERRAAQARWRRTRHWLALSSAGVAVLFAVSVAQTVALVRFSHRAQAMQQQTESALNDQRAALAGLASMTSALAARGVPLAQPDAAPDSSSAAHVAKRPAKHSHKHHLKEQAKLAAR